MGRDTALEEPDPGLASAAVAWVEAAQAPVDREPAEAARGVGPQAVGQVRVVRVGACGSPALVGAELARDPGLRARAVRARVEEPGATQGVEAAPAPVVGEQEVEAAAARVPGRAVVPVAVALGPARATAEREAVGERERPLLENG